jgi:hypothetical protein
MKKLVLISVLCGFLTSISAQNVDKLVWFGVDFTASKFVLVPENPQEIVTKYLPAINYVILSEPAKYDIRKYFNASELAYNIDPVLELNEKIDPSTLVASKEQTLDKEKVNEIIGKYETGNESGTGLVFIAVNLNKAAGMAGYYVCLFDIASKKIQEIKYMSAPVGGIGFRNYWVSSVYKVMNMWSLRHGSSDPLYN